MVEPVDHGVNDVVKARETPFHAAEHAGQWHAPSWHELLLLLLHVEHASQERLAVLTLGGPGQ